MKIFNNNLKINSKPINFRTKVGDVGKIKYLPSFSKEWKNTVYSYNKDELKNVPLNNIHVNKIIKSYFDLYFKDSRYTGSKLAIPIKKRRAFLRKIYVSNAEIKYTNNKAIITLFTVNREKKILKRKYIKINKKISNNLIKRYFFFYKNNIAKIYDILNKHKDEYTFISDKITKKRFLSYKLEYLTKFIKLKHLYLRKVWSVIINKYTEKYLTLLRKYDLLYSLNQYKFNKQILLPKLSSLLNKTIGKKIEYNFINLKSIAYNTDIFTNVLALKLSKDFISHEADMLSVFNRAHLPRVNAIKERSLMNKDNILFSNEYKDLNLISNLPVNHQNKFDELLNKIHHKTNLDNNKEIHNTIFNSIGYKNMAGIRLQVKGRLSKRFRADRASYSLKWKGGLKNVDSSFKRLSSVLFRGNFNSNASYSLTTAKRRVGAFAVKGWIGGK